MACLFPVGVYRNDGSLTGRPCGQCLSCRIETSRGWAIRCVHEAQMHEDNSYITLTFNKENYPKNGSLHKKYIQSFMRKIRAYYKKPIRFFGCGEYGDEKMRAHYHICLFGHQFKDLEVHKCDIKTRSKPVFKRGHDHTLYTSKELSEIWKYGFHTIGELTYESAAYVARYVVKKITGSSPEARRMFAEKYGDRKPEFALMSRMPGIGKSWFDKYYNDVYPKDFIMHNGTRFKPPRFYDNLYNRINPEQMEEIKQKRREAKSDYEMLMHDEHESWNRELYRIALTKTFNRDQTT